MLKKKKKKVALHYFIIDSRSSKNNSLFLGNMISLITDTNYNIIYEV